ncbi:glycosyltransferase [Arcicella rigui]|uniref:Glycosyltransferase n=1 Tax=Arcicella rigui TaxID=797020 RepID=A0ABU5Q8U8_9BACT|nr:glycosyltransferase [Arcicella rigui]MEA5139266.1 glycosyltransferase [Arcicella rigui]
MMSLRKKILLFEPDASGHHSDYLFALLINYYQQNYSFDLTVLVAPDFLEKHPKIVEQTSSEQIRWMYLNNEEATALKNVPSVLKRANLEWKIFNQYAASVNAVYGFLMYIDYFQLTLIRNQQSFCPVSGIFFRPTLVNYTSASLKERLNYWRKNIMLKYVVKSKTLDSLFTLDTYAADFIRTHWQTDKVKYLPDPLHIYPVHEKPQTTKQSLGITDERKVFLIFGFLDSRKGVSKVLEVIQKLSPNQAKKGCLLIVGGWEATEKQRFEVLKNSINNDFQIVTLSTFIPKEDIQLYFEASDYILALYDKHIGMSGIMVRAAAAQKPLITYNFGLMGKIASSKQLGIVVDENLEEDLFQKMSFLLENTDTIGDTQQMKAYAEINQDVNYAKAIFEQFEKVVSQA